MFFQSSLLLFCIPLAANVFICFNAICSANLNSDVMTYDSLIFSSTHSTFVTGGSRATINSILSLMYLWLCEGSNDTQRVFPPFVSVLCNRTPCHKDCDQSIMKSAKPLSVMAKICKLYILFNYWRMAFQRDMHCSKEASQHLSFLTKAFYPQTRIYLLGANYQSVYEEV